MKLWPLLWVALLLSGCGGGGASSSLRLQLIDDEPRAGGSIALLASQAGSWQQLEGPAVSPANWQQQLLAFDLPTAGDYRFVFTADSGQQAELQFTASAEAAPVQLRRDRQQPGGSRLSLRASGDGAEWQWRQRSGSTATMTSDGALAFITLPRVDQAELLAFEVSTEIDGQPVSEVAAVWVTPTPEISSGAYFSAPLVATRAWQGDSPYAAALERCLYSNALSRSCTLAELPLLAMDGEAPSREQVLARLLVSEPWMGEQFARFLDEQDEHGDFRQLLGAVTGIVISHDLRPSFYWSATGAIYLDADYLWLTPEQRDLINEQPDYRGDYGKELAFDMLWRYTRDNGYAFSRPLRSAREPRSMAQLALPLSFLLYHELAHANDFFPRALRAQLAPELSVALAAASLGSQRLSSQLRQQQPLQSTLLTELAAISFRGASSTAEQRAVQPEQVAAAFAGDGAGDYYNYASQYEDLAMLFEELMMSSRLGVARDVAVTNQPEGDATAADYIVNWGQRGRVAAPGVRERALWVAEQILPDADPATLLEQLPEPVTMRPGESWLDNLQQGEVVANPRLRRVPAAIVQSVERGHPTRLQQGE